MNVPHDTATPLTTSGKMHYPLLDGLRGVASLMVIGFHIFEAFATSPLDQKFNHGYLAVDFFFILSGFVIGYAYDDRWQTMSTAQFFKRRLIRLHPMVIIGALLGLITFCIQGGVRWDGTSVTTSAIMLATLLGLFLIPVSPDMTADVRGAGEMFPLNGPSWSLFFEYFGNILYALALRRLSTRVLSIFVACMGSGLAIFAIGNFSDYGTIGVGWTLAGNNFIGGSLRMLFAFPAGLLLSRIFKPIPIKGAFWLCSALIIGAIALPHVGGEQALWMNGMYDSACALILFPMIVWIGASGVATHAVSKKLCAFLGDISYPVYIIHYPFMYLFYAWTWGSGIFARADGSKLTFAQSWPVAILICINSIVLAYCFLKFYDAPLRRRLSKI